MCSTRRLTHPHAAICHTIETYSFLERTHAQHARVSVRPLIFFFKAEASAEKISKAMTLPGTVKKVGVQAGSGGSVLKCSGADLSVAPHAALVLRNRDCATDCV